MKIEPTQLTVGQLLNESREQFIVPSYQRRYSWRDKQINELFDDIDALRNQDTHLLGSIVCLVNPHNAGIAKLELVDGQQRTTTLLIVLHCIWEHLNKSEDEAAIGVRDELRRCLESKSRFGKAEPKIVLDSLDADEFTSHLSKRDVDNPSNKALANAFDVVRSRIAQYDFNDLLGFIEKLLDHSLLIRLDISEARDAYKLFEIINNRGLKLNSTDIIKNFILGNAAGFDDHALETAKKKWSEILKSLDGLSTEDFFRNYLCAQQKRRITAAYVIANFKELFFLQVREAGGHITQKYASDDELDPVNGENFDEDDQYEDFGENSSISAIKVERLSFQDFIERIASHARIYRQIVKAETDNPAINRHLRNLQLIKAAQTYSFLMALRAGGCSDKNFLEVLKITESLMLRRHICRERSNENESLFARLCGIDPANPVPAIKAAVQKYVPSDEKFQQAFQNYEFSANLIGRARYCLEQFEQASSGQYQELAVLGAESVEVEHIVPQQLTDRRIKGDHDGWVGYLGENFSEKHRQLISTIGNLTLFHGSLNVMASNYSYDEKKKFYEKSSITMTKSLPQAVPEFRFPQLQERSQQLAELALTTWPRSAFD